MPTKRKHILFFFSLWLSSYCLAQHPPVWNLDDQDGLPSLTVYDMLEDSKGYLWLGLENGLFRYNGIEFVQFMNASQKGLSMSGLQEDKAGRVWATNFYGQLFYIKKDSLHRLQLLDSLPAQSYINGYAVDDQNQLWLTNNTSHSIFKIDMTQGVWEEIKLDKNLGKHSYFRDIHQRADGSIWLTENQTGLWQIHPRIQCFGKPNQALADAQFKLIEVGEHLLLADIISGSGQLLYSFSETAEFEQLPHTITARINDLYKDKAANVWISTNGGLYLLEENFELAPLPQPLMEKRSISSLIQDREGAYWIGSLNSGLYFMPSSQVLVYNQANAGLPDNRITSITSKADGTIFLGTSNGKVALIEHRQLKDILDCPTNARVNDLLWAEQKQRLYAAQGSLSEFDLSYNSPRRELLYGSVKNCALLEDETLACATSKYPMILVPNPQDTNIFQQRFPLVEDKRGRRIHLRKMRARYMLKDKFEEQLWCVYSDQLYRHTETEDVVISPENPITALCLAQTDDSTIWVGTINESVLAIRNDSIVFRLNEQDGLAGNLCNVIETDGKNLWLGTNKGLHFYNPSTQELSIFNQYDGLIANEITDIELVKDKLWVSTLKGVHEIPLPVLKPDVQPPIYITNFAIDERDTTLQTAYELPYWQNNIKIAFEGISSRSFDALQYKYRMLGLDSTWISANNKTNFARFPSLQAGDYSFEVKAVNANGLESAESAILELSIRPPYWQRWWFYVLLTLASIGIVAFIFWRRLRNIQKRNEIENALRSSKLTALRAQMNPHFLFNAINSIQDFILMGDKRQANSYLGKFANLMRSILEMSEEDEVTLEEVISALKLYLDLESLRFEDSFEYTLEVAPDIQTESLYVPPMLIQPHVENAMKHGLLHRKTNRRLHLAFTLPKPYILQCVVEDNGIGRAAARQLKGKHLGFATKATEKRLALLNQSQHKDIQLHIIDLMDEHEQACGTRIVLRVSI